MRRDQLNDEYLELLDKQRLYFKTVKDFKEVIFSVGSWSVCWYKSSIFYSINLGVKQYSPVGVGMVTKCLRYFITVLVFSLRHRYCC